jgi:hypothetical protein
MGELRNAYDILVKKPEWKRPLRRPRCRWEDNIRMDHRETGLEGLDWLHLTQDREQCWPLVNMIMNLWVPQKVGDFLTRCIMVYSQEELSSMEFVMVDNNYIITVVW